MRGSGQEIRRMGREPIPTSRPLRNMKGNGWMERSMAMGATSIPMGIHTPGNGRMEKNSII